MKKLLLSIGLAAVAPLVWGQTESSTTTTTTTTTTGTGTITEYTPGSSIVLKETSGPRTYHFGKEVVYVTKSGKVIDADKVRERVKVGVPVHVIYSGEGENMVVNKVELEDDDD